MMICQDILFCLREAAFHLAAKKPEECLTNLGCGCSHPGKELHCEECPYLEACLSRTKPFKVSIRQLKVEANNC